MTAHLQVVALVNVDNENCMHSTTHHKLKGGKALQDNKWSHLQNADGGDNYVSGNAACGHHLWRTDKLFSMHLGHSCGHADKSMRERERDRDVGNPASQFWSRSLCTVN